MDKVFKPIKSGTLIIGEMEFLCAVLEDETRVISERGITKALGGKRGGAHWRRKKAETIGANLPVFLSANNLTDYISDELRVALTSPIFFTTESNSVANGIKADLIPDICEVWLNAKDGKSLLSSQEHIYAKAKILHRALAHTGIIALVDEATGYQEIRDKRALQTILEKYIAKEYLDWTKTFPDEFYKEMFRLKGWSINPIFIKRPSVIGTYTRDIVYDRLAPGLMICTYGTGRISEKVILSTITKRRLRKMPEKYLFGLSDGTSISAVTSMTREEWLIERRKAANMSGGNWNWEKLSDQPYFGEQDI